MSKWVAPRRGEIQSMNLRQLKVLANRFSNELAQAREDHENEARHRNSQRNERGRVQEENDSLKRSVELFKQAIADRDKTIAGQAESISKLEADKHDLLDRLERAERRLTQALETADNAALATAAISRITNSLGQCIDTLETKLDLENKETRTRRFRP